MEVKFLLCIVVVIFHSGVSVLANSTTEAAPLSRIAFGSCANQSAPQESPCVLLEVRFLYKSLTLGPSSFADLSVSLLQIFCTLLSPGCLSVALKFHWVLPCTVFKRNSLKLASLMYYSNFTYRPIVSTLAVLSVLTAAYTDDWGRLLKS
eukprot:Gb_18781 [translate_table: standard]